jgi:hypothetical protein
MNMKRIKLLFISLIGLIIITPKQSIAQAFEQNVNIIHAGIGFGEIRHDSYYNSYNETSSDRILPVSISYERGVTNHLSIGVYAGYSSIYRTTTFDTIYWMTPGIQQYKWDYEETKLIVAARGAYHFVFGESFEMNLGVMFGYSMDTKNNFTSDLSTVPPPSDSSTSDFGVGFYIGANYYFNDRVGVYAELGGGTIISIFSVGVALKF